MKLHEKGVLPQSDIYICNSSMIKKEYFYQMLCIGHYFCSHSYSVRANTLDSYLLIYVVSGELYIVPDGRNRLTVSTGQLAILNCYERPSYGCTSSAEFYWIHFDSHGIDELYEILPARTAYAADQQATQRCFTKLISQFEDGMQPDEAIVNKYITIILTEFFAHDSDSISGIPQKKFDSICSYISNNPEKKITNDELAKMASMSLYHFIRSFRKETGFTPHEFIIRSRVNTAMFLLRTTEMPISEIACRCGFSNEPAFSSGFKSITGISPLLCRQQSLKHTRCRAKIAEMKLISQEETDP